MLYFFLASATIISFLSKGNLFPFIVKADSLLWSKVRPKYFKSFRHPPSLLTHPLFSILNYILVDTVPELVVVIGTSISI